MYPDTVEKSFILAKVIELFGFVLYPDMDFSECIPNKLFLNREAGIPFLAFSERMFRKCKTFQLSAAPNPEIQNIEERNEDVPDLMDAHGEEFELADSDFDEGDEELEFVESFT